MKLLGLLQQTQFHEDLKNIPYDLTNLTEMVPLALVKRDPAI